MVKSLYIHIPFCDQICAYCDFTKVFSSSFSHKEYLKKLIAEIDSLVIKDDSLSTIYIGGGTPSTLTSEELDFLLSYLHQHFPNVDEFSVEANPESLTREKIKLMHSYGVNRISLGAQTTNELILKQLNRNHTTNDIKRCIKDLKDCGIENYNLDFIYGIPGMTMGDLDRDIDFALKMNTKHLSFYSLQIEEGTLLYNQGMKPVDEEFMRRMYDFIIEKLSKHGYQRYEISNFSLPGYESRHNLTYWHDEQYYAAGVSASGYIGNLRYTNTKSLTHYLKGEYNRESETIDSKTEEFEFLMLNLRLTKGFSLSSFKKRFHKDFKTEYKEEIEKVQDYVEIVDDHFRIRKDYLYTMDNILLNLLK
jgi:oxygen-independent coproporphyrinogen III oxidase